MEKMKRGRPTLNDSPRDKRLSIKVTAEELERIQTICIKHNLRYIDVIEKGLEFWSNQK